MPVSFAEVLPFILIGFLIAAILFFYFRYLKKRSISLWSTQNLKFHPFRPIWALEQLDNLIKREIVATEKG
jgi:hypothetical protein